MTVAQAHIDHHKHVQALYEKLLALGLSITSDTLLQSPNISTSIHKRVRHPMLLLKMGRTGDYPSSLEYYKKSLELRTRLLGPKHPDVSLTLNNLGCFSSYTL